MDKGGRLELTIADGGPERQCRWETADAYPQENIESIFNPFFTTKGKGTVCLGW
jgi:C4-dicarboxylate-specific signal transduction histidine kinase